MKNHVDSLKIHYNGKDRSINGEFNSVEFMNEGYYIIYIPSLQLSAYGKDQSEAENMMKNVVLKDFAESLIQNPLVTVIRELKDLGFKQSPFFKSELSKSAHINKEGILKDFDLSEDTQMKERLVTV